MGDRTSLESSVMRRWSTAGKQLSSVHGADRVRSPMKYLSDVGQHGAGVRWVKKTVRSRESEVHGREAVMSDGQQRSSRESMVVSPASTDSESDK